MYQTTIVEIWTFRNPAWATMDLSGFEVEALDGSIGKVSKTTHEADPGHLIVETGPWIFGKRVMLPAGVVTNVQPQQRKVVVNITKDQIKNAPEYDDSLYGDAKYRDSVGSYYGANRPAGPDYGHDDLTHGIDDRPRR